MVDSGLHGSGEKREADEQFLDSGGLHPRSAGEQHLLALANSPRDYRRADQQPAWFHRPKHLKPLYCMQIRHTGFLILQEIHISSPHGSSSHFARCRAFLSCIHETFRPHTNTPTHTQSISTSFKRFQLQFTTSVLNLLLTESITAIDN